MSKCLIFFGQNRLSEVFYYYLNNQINIDEFDVYISGWLYEQDKLDHFKKYFKIKNYSLIDPSTYLSEHIDSFNVRNKKAMIDVCNIGNCQAFAQHISMDNIKTFVNLKKYNNVYITRSDSVNLFDISYDVIQNTIYDRVISNKKINGNFLYGDGLGCYNFCKNFLKNTVEYFDRSTSSDKGSPRFLWHNNALQCGVNISNIKLNTLFIRPGVEKYEWQKPYIIDTWDLFNKLKRYTNCVDNINFKDISIEELVDYKHTYLDCT